MRYTFVVTIYNDGALAPDFCREIQRVFAKHLGIADLTHALEVLFVDATADGLDWSPLEVALTWVRDRPGVTAPIVGARTAAQLRGSLTVEELSLPDQIVAALDDVSASDF